MDDEAHFSIGAVSRRTGLTIKAVRLYADRGIVLPIRRNSAGHRVYDAAAVARLEWVRTLREIGLDLATIGRVVHQQVSLPEVAAAHAKALAVQIRALRLRQAVVTAVITQGSTLSEMNLMNSLARLSGLERAQLIEEFLADALGDLRSTSDFVGIGRSLTPELPDDPSIEQLAAWVELAELTRDQQFRNMLRQLADQHAAHRALGGDGVPQRDLAALIRQQVEPALAAGVDPTSALADAVTTIMIERCAQAMAGTTDNDVVVELLTWLKTVDDPRRERYLRLLSVINDWPPPESLTPVFDWSMTALQARLAG